MRISMVSADNEFHGVIIISCGVHNYFPAAPRRPVLAQLYTRSSNFMQSLAAYPAPINTPVEDSFSVSVLWA